MAEEMQRQFGLQRYSPESIHASTYNFTSEAKPSLEKSKEHTKALKRRIDSMQKGDLESILEECRGIQHRIKPMIDSKLVVVVVVIGLMETRL